MLNIKEHHEKHFRGVWAVGASQYNYLQTTGGSRWPSSSHSYSLRVAPGIRMFRVQGERLNCNPQAPVSKDRLKELLDSGDPCDFLASLLKETQQSSIRR